MKRMLRWDVPIDGQPHERDVVGTVLAVGARSIGVPHAEAAWTLDLWTEWTEDSDITATTHRTFQVYGTGWGIPDSAIWRGTAPRTAEGLVWHLYEHPREVE